MTYNLCSYKYAFKSVITFPKKWILRSIAFTEPSRKREGQAQ